MNRRWDIWDEMRRMQSSMDELFSYFFGSEAGTPLLEAPLRGQTALTNYRQPLADVFETDKELVATIELPGVDKKDIKINATDEGVEVKVERKDERKQDDKKQGLYRLERSYLGFYRYIPVPDGVDTDNIKASYNNGVLELRMPKIEDKRKSKVIKVE